MWFIIIAVFLYFIINLKDERLEEDWDRSFLLPYSNHYINFFESDDPDDWIDFEPNYITRYINVFASNNSYIVNLSRQKKDGAIETISFASQREADIWMKFIHFDYHDKPITFTHDSNFTYINVFNNSDNVIEIEISNEAASHYFEQIKCIDYDEALALIDGMTKYYEQHRIVKLQNYIMS